MYLQSMRLHTHTRPRKRDLEAVVQLLCGSIDGALVKGGVCKVDVMAAVAEAMGLRHPLNDAGLLCQRYHCKPGGYSRVQMSKCGRVRVGVGEGTFGVGWWGVGGHVWGGVWEAGLGVGGACGPSHLHVLKAKYRCTSEACNALRAMQACFRGCECCCSYAEVMAWVDC